MQIMRVAESCQLSNKAEFVVEPHYITNHQKKKSKGMNICLGSENVKSTTMKNSSKVPFSNMALVGHLDFDITLTLT
mgnify:CR=1 FL=1